MVFGVYDKNSYGRDPDGKIKEGWTFVDSMYFGVVTITTVGYGDLHAMSDAGKICAIFYAPFGVLGLGAVLGKIAVLIVQLQDRAADDIEETIEEILESKEKEGVPEHRRKSTI